MTARKKRAFKFALYGELCLLCFVVLISWLPIANNPSWITGPFVTICVIIKGIALLALAPAGIIVGGVTTKIGWPQAPSLTFDFLVIAYIANTLLYGTIGYLLGYFTYRPGPGLCRKCEYNLTGNESGICPECGTVIKP